MRMIFDKFLDQKSIGPRFLVHSFITQNTQEFFCWVDGTFPKTQNSHVESCTIAAVKQKTKPFTQAMASNRTDEERENALATLQRLVQSAAAQ